MRLSLHISSTVKVGEHYHKVQVGIEDDMDGSFQDVPQEEVLDMYDGMEAMLQEVLAEKLSNTITEGEGIAAKYKSKRRRR